MTPGKTLQSQDRYQAMVDRILIIEAYEHARSSPDPSTQNAAIITTESGFRVYGVNTTPFGIHHRGDRLQRPKKYDYVEHAERAAIYHAARAGVRTYGATMYCPWYACTDCARAIIAAGIRRVVGHKLPEHQKHPRWQESIAYALEMLREAGVVCDLVKGKLGCSPIRMNSELVFP